MLFRNSIKIFTLLLCLVFSTIGWSYTILIDPGHGGNDYGATALVTLKGKKKVKKRIYEKHLSLELSRKIYEELRVKGYNVYLTRSFDHEVSLQKRADIAEKLNADIFISVHFNSSLTKNSHGYETYYLDNKRDKAVNKLEEVENYSALKGEDLIIHQIITDLVVEKTVIASRKLAESVHKQVGKKMKRFKIRDRGVRAGMFFVLAFSKRPGILLEVGFLSNPKELKKMQRSNFQKRYAKSVAQGIDDYVKKTLVKSRVPML